MIPKGLFSQIGMIIIAVAIIATYVQPTFGEIEQVQNTIGTYELERDKVIGVNSKLAVHEATLNQISNDDEKRLLMYMPDSVDEIAVLRDLEIITIKSGALLKGVTYSGEAQSDASDEQTQEVVPIGHTFDLQVEGTYSQIKVLLSLLDQNAYPLVAQSVALQPLEGSFLSANIRLMTYEFQDEVESIVGGSAEIIF
jgi:hypothetical protein